MNQEKINQHGKRAHAIVKDMLQHSRSSSGQKELVDINALVDEYLLTNGFYAVSEKKKMATANYRPTVSVDTKLMIKCR